MYVLFKQISYKSDLNKCVLKIYVTLEKCTAQYVFLSFECDLQNQIQIRKHVRYFIMSVR